MNLPAVDPSLRASLLRWGGMLPRVLCMGVLWLALLWLGALGLGVLGVLGVGLGALLPCSIADAAPDAPLPEPVTADAFEKGLKRTAALLKDKRAADEDLVAALERLVGERAQLDAPSSKLARLDKKILKILLKAATLRHPATRHTVVGVLPAGEHRDVVNRAAARLLEDVGVSVDEKQKRSLARRIHKEIKALQKTRDPETWRAQSIEALFLTLARIGSPESIEWILKEHVHTKSREIVFLIAAQKALLAFPDPSGKLRREVFDVFLKTYLGVEAVARRNNGSPGDRAKKRLWDALREHTIPVFQRYAKAPRNAKEEALSTVLEFHRWYLEHKNPRRAPWVD